jgi:hypothetical protein
MTKLAIHLYCLNDMLLVAAAAAMYVVPVPAAAQNHPGDVSPTAPTRQAPPPWAYPIQPPVQPAPDDGIPKRLTGSTAAFTLTQIRDLFVAPDWYPGDHPAMPEVVARGR